MSHGCSISVTPVRGISAITALGLFLALASVGQAKPAQANRDAAEANQGSVDSKAKEPKEAASADEKKRPADHGAKKQPRQSREEAADKNDDEGKSDDDKEAANGATDESKPVVTHHTTTINGKEIAYTATAGKMLMKTDEGEPKAHVFFVAYTKDADGSRDAKAKRNGKKDKGDDADAKDAQPDPTRPITYCFNGGPGSSSVWLHLGMLGPTRVKLDSDAQPLPPPHVLTENPYSLLDVTDLVFIDPVSTGFSRPARGEDKKQFHGYHEDLRSVGQFIHDYTTKYGRWGSPKFLIGESYGGLRAAGLCGELQNRYRLYLNGVVLVSAVVDFQTLMTWGNNDIAYTLFLPSYTATAWYHKRLSDELQSQTLEDVVAAAEKFASGPYLRALAAGDSLSEQQRTQVIERMSELTGLPADYIDAANLRVSMPQFGKHLLKSEDLIVGRFDSRYTGLSLEPTRDTTEYDPSASGVFGSFGSALNDYLRHTLKVEEDRVYEIITDKVHPWDYSEFTNQYVDGSETLRYAMTLNPHLKVFAACGYYDLATPSFAMEHTRDHLNLAPEIRENFTMDFYEAGHMMYAHEPSLEKMRKDLLKFYESALPKPK